MPTTTSSTNHATGALFYDSNGNAAGGVTQLATLTNHPVLAANDFVVIINSRHLLNAFCCAIPLRGLRQLRAPLAGIG